MNVINEHNYEAFLLDALEGRLTAEQQLELETFMALHPELSVELEGLSDLSFDPEQTVFPDKNGLKKTASDLVAAEQFIAYIEGQLNPEERRLLEESCAANPALALELKLYQHTIAQADEQIVFENKAALKRQPKFILLNVRTSAFAAAASVALLLLLYVLWPSPTAQGVDNSYALREARKSAGQAKTPAINIALSQEPKTTSNSHIRQSGTRNDPQQLLAGQTKLPEQKTPVGTPSATQTPEVPNLAKAPEHVDEPVAPLVQEPLLMASSARSTVVDVIVEQDSDEALEGAKRQGFWAMAGKTLKGLNKAGVKAVNGEEDANRNNAVYALTLGKLNITHTSH